MLDAIPHAIDSMAFTERCKDYVASVLNGRSAKNSQSLS